MLIRLRCAMLTASLVLLLTASCGTRTEKDPVPTIWTLDAGDFAQLVATLVSILVLGVMLVQVKHAQQQARDAEGATAKAQATSAEAVTQAARIADAMAERARADEVAALTTVAGACAGVATRLRAAVVLSQSMQPGRVEALSHLEWVGLVRDLPGELRTCATILGAVQDSVALLGIRDVEDVASARVLLEGVACRVVSMDLPVGRIGAAEIQDTTGIARATIDAVAPMVESVSVNAKLRLEVLETAAKARAADAASGHSAGISAPKS